MVLNSQVHDPATLLGRKEAPLTNVLNDDRVLGIKTQIWIFMCISLNVSIKIQATGMYCKISIAFYMSYVSYSHLITIIMFYDALINYRRLG
jgi:hypothetical protein